MKRIIRIGRVVAGRLIVAKQKDDSFADQFFQFRPSADVCFFAKHGVRLKFFYIFCKSNKKINITENFKQKMTSFT